MGSAGAVTLGRAHEGTLHLLHFHFQTESLEVMDRQETLKFRRTVH